MGGKGVCGYNQFICVEWARFRGGEEVVLFIGQCCCYAPDSVPDTAAVSCPPPNTHTHTLPLPFFVSTVVPLFETLDDLTNAPQTIDTLLGSEWYRSHIQTHHGGVQEVMIGEWVCVFLGGGGAVWMWVWGWVWVLNE